MLTIFLSILILAIMILAMSVGVIFANKPIKGSCGGMAAAGIDTECDICGGDTSKCDEEQKKTPAMNKLLAYDAANK